METNFTKPVHWENEGIEPSTTLRKTGFQGGYKPPASVFNHFFYNNEKCIKELQTAANSLDANKSDSDHTHSYAGSSSAGGAANELINREQFSITNTTSARYKYIKLGKVSTSNSGSRAMIQLIGRSSYNDMEAGGKVEICLSCNDAINTNNCRIGALVFAYGNSASNSTVTNTWATDVLIVRAEGYSMAEADVYLKFTSDANFTSYFAVVEKQDTFKWATDVVFTNTDPTENAVHSYTAPKKIIRDDYLSANEPLKTSASGKLLYNATSLSSSSITIDIANLFENYSAVVCNVVTSGGRYSLTLPLSYIKALGTSEFYEAEGLLFYYVDDSNLNIKTGLGQVNPTISSVKIINLY
ncbi:MAG: hypothetical protein K2I33_02605 [Oscillospiraceae bacterium]|nr:hypothetical protein [Oscillospiraceae bacterium]